MVGWVGWDDKRDIRKGRKLPPPPYSASYAILEDARCYYQPLISSYEFPAKFKKHCHIEKGFISMKTYFMLSITMHYDYK